MLRYLDRIGVDFHFLHIAQEDGDQQAMMEAWGAQRCTFLEYEFPRRKHARIKWILTRIGRKLGLVGPVFPYGIDDWCDERLIRAVRQVVGKMRPTAVQIEYVFFSKLFETFDNCIPRILDTHDRMADRHQIYVRQRKLPEWFYTTKKQERKGLRRADVVLAIQDNERKFFEKLSGKECVTVGHTVQITERTTRQTTSPTLLFLGSSNTVNDQALGILLESIWPTILVEIPDAVLKIAGGVSHPITSPPPGVEACGFVEDLGKTYGEAWVVISPLWSGTGLKIKSIEALGYGKPLVCAPSGAEGMEDGAGRAFLLADTPQDFATEVIRLLRDTDLRESLSSTAIEYVINWNARQEASYTTVLRKTGLLSERDSTAPPSVP
jgi:glycosyltransferase involved in cell wall biosynthesis